jgi:hypothetical protein
LNFSPLFFDFTGLQMYVYSTIKKYIYKILTQNGEKNMI